MDLMLRTAAGMFSVLFTSLRKGGVIAAFLLGGLLLSTQLARAEFPGWQGMRVIEQKGRPYILRAADLDGDDREELLVVNSRSSRLDIYHWRDVDEAKTELVDEQRPNDLPLAPEIKHDELQLEHVPRDVLVQDLDGDGLPELVVLVSSPNKVMVYGHELEGDWDKRYEVDLLGGDIPSRRELLLIRTLADGALQLLVSLDNGIQQLLLEPGEQAQWLTPREKRGRVSWWLADLDADGREDLVEQTRESNESVRWYRCSESGTLMPAAVLFDRSAKDVEVIHTSGKAQLAILDGTVSGILRRYDLDEGELSPFGLQRPLALKDGAKAVWCGMMQGEQPALVVADSSAPRLLSYGLSETGWEAQRAYPALTDIRAMATLASEPGTLLMWTKDAADLRRSRWEAGRLTYPEAWEQSTGSEVRKILALDTVGPITWWVQQLGEGHLDLYLAKPDEKEPTKIRFPKVGRKADQVLWIGGGRLLVKEKNGRGLKLFALEGDKAKVTSPSHLKKATPAEFKLFTIGDDVRLGRMTDGVLQWLGDDLRSQEQVMLPQGQELADYVANDESGGWALQRESPYVHRMEIDASRLSRSVERIKVGDGASLLQDPVLGMLLVNRDRVTQLREGRPWKLDLKDVVDERVGREGGVRKTRLHRLSTTDVDGDGYEDLVLYDELQHRLTVLEDQEGVLKPKIAWPVFDDKVYPYSDESDKLVKEPRTVLAADFDGDGLQDLAVLCHDRLIFYLARERS